MLSHSFVLDCLETTAAETFSHFEVLIEEHRRIEAEGSIRPSPLKQLVPTVGAFHTRLPLRQAFEIYNEKHRLTNRKHIQISFNEIRHILNLAQVMAMRTPFDYDSARKDELFQSVSHLPDDDDGDIKEESIQPEQWDGPKMITFDADQTLYTDGSNFDSNPRLANYLYLLLRHGVAVAIVTAAGYEYNTEKYEYRLSGLLEYFKAKQLTAEECERFFLFGGECNYLLHLGSDFRLHPVKEVGRGGWITATKFLDEAPGNWSDVEIKELLDTAEEAVEESVKDQNIRGRVIRKRRSVGMVPMPGQNISREALDETVLRCQTKLTSLNNGTGPTLPFCAFNGGKDVWVDAGNKKVAVRVLGAYLDVDPSETLHIGDQFLNTGNDFAARAVCPCIWITSPTETTYILKTILRLAGVPFQLENEKEAVAILSGNTKVDFAEMHRRVTVVQEMDVYTGEMKK